MADCSQIRAALIENRRPLDAELDAHAASCPVCNELLAQNATLGRVLATAGHATPQIPEANLAAVVARGLERDRGVLGRLRALGSGQRVAIATAVAVLPVFLFSIGNPRALTPGRWVTVAFAVLLVVATASLLAPLGRLRRDARQIGLAALALAVPAIRFSLVGSTTAVATDGTWDCFAIGALCSAPVFALLHIIARRPGFSFAELLLVGGIAGLSANMALQLHCVDKRIEHLFAGHAFTGIVWIACSWLAARRIVQRG